MALTRDPQQAALQVDGVGRLLGVEIMTASPQLVVANLAPTRRHAGPTADVQEGVVLALADYAASYGIRLGCPDGHAPSTLGSTTSFLGQAEGGQLRAEAARVRSAPHHAVWRTRVTRGEAAIAEVVQTAVYLPAGRRRGRPGAAPAEDADADALRDMIARARPLPDNVLSALERPVRARRGGIVDERRRQIFEAACRVIAEKGFAKASIREIAAAAEMPVPTMYQYLERKEDLLYGIYEYFMHDLAEALQKWRSSSAPPRQKIEGAIRTMIDEYDRNHRYIKIMFQETRSLTPDGRRRVYDLDGRYIATLRELLEEAAEDSGWQIGDPELTANFVYFLCVVWPLRYWTIGKYGEETVTREIVDFILRALGSERAAA